MAITTGLVQRLTLFGNTLVGNGMCVWIGPSPSNTELLVVQRLSGDSAQAGDLKTSMVNALVTAQVSRREVSVVHGDSDAFITSVTINPA